MPEIARFLGIVVGMFYSEHGVPHFHAVYGEHGISVEIESRRVHGRFPRRARRAQPLKPVAPLRDPEVFRQFTIHPEFHTLVWPNGADVAPEYLHEHVRVTA